MEIGLIEGLIDKNVLIPGSKLTVSRPLWGMGGMSQGWTEETVKLSYIRKQDEKVEFHCMGNDGRQYQILPKHVLSIDGMEPTKLAGVYGLKSDGSKKNQGKKRGRKPKLLIIT